MYRTILVPLDRSGFAEHALPYALGLARATRASIHLVQAHVLPGIGPPHEMIGGVFEEVDAQLRLRESNYLESLAARLASEVEVPVWPRLLDGPVDSALTEYATSTHADLIVMSTHGEGGIKRAWLGSVTDALVRRATVPLLLIRPKLTSQLSQGAERPRAAAGSSETAAFSPIVFEHFVIAVDGSPVAEEAAERASELALLMRARMTLLTIIQPPHYAGSGYLPHLAQANRAELTNLEAEATTYLARLATRFAQRGVHVAERVAADYHAPEAILREARDLGADLVVLGTRGHGGLRRMVLGSVADKVIRGASLPVFVLPERAVRAGYVPADRKSGMVVI